LSIVLSHSTLEELHRLHAAGESIRRISILLAVARQTVRRHLGFTPARVPPRVLSVEDKELALELYLGSCQGNATAVARVLAERGSRASTRTVQRALAGIQRTPARDADEAGGPVSEERPVVMGDNVIEGVEESCVARG